LFDNTLDFKNVGAESLIDAQIGYSVGSGALKGLSVSLSGTNLTDEPFVLNNIDTIPYHTIKYQNFGATYAVALSYVFQ
jgi:iron complex outermembrane receptor protein